jgi:hypothetical protein
MSLEIATPDLASDEMDLKAGTRSRRRRRSLTWLAFGLVGLIMGAVWAVGLATSTSAIGSTATATQVFGTAPVAAGTSQYAGLVTVDTALTISFAGTWGKIDTDTAMFEVDLTAETGTYFVAVYLNNNATGWSALNLKFLQVDTVCSSADFSSPIASSVMVVETEDAWAVFPTLASGATKTYCFGIEAITPKANDETGTYIRKPSPGSSPTAPVFVALLNRSA